jgi:outer membrane protein assembly factor BamA
MTRKKYYHALLGSFSVLFLIFSGTGLSAQPETQHAKTGWTLGALPVLSYNSDLGFQYGGLVNLYFYGDGSSYPGYMQSIFAEISRYTKGSGINRLFYDSEYLVPGLRVTADLSYFTEKALDFYGFNGYNAVYNPFYEDDIHEFYKSRMFYRHERNMFRFTLDFQGPISGRQLRWVGGIGLLNSRIAPVDIAAMNKGQDETSMLPDINGLYERYVDWGIISPEEKDGGNAHHFKIGIIYDTRDNEPNPMTGIWSEAVVVTAPGFVGNGDYSHTRISVTHRQYFTIIENDLSFAFRLNYQGTLGGKVPFYMLPYRINSFSLASNTDGLGGSKTVRGILRNRVVGENMVFGNFELRWKFYRTVLFNQHIYLALNGFADAGQVITKKEIKEPSNDDFYDFYSPGREAMHISLGGGFRMAMNENFIIAVDYGNPLDNRDGGGGIYIGMNYLF